MTNNNNQHKALLLISKWVINQLKQNILNHKKKLNNGRESHNHRAHTFAECIRFDCLNRLTFLRFCFCVFVAAMRDQNIQQFSFSRFEHSATVVNLYKQLNVTCWRYTTYIFILRTEI